MAFHSKTRRILLGIGILGLLGLIFSALFMIWASSFNPIMIVIVVIVLLVLLAIYWFLGSGVMKLLGRR